MRVGYVYVLFTVPKRSVACSIQTVKCIEGTTKFASLVGLPGIQLSSSARVVPYLQGPAK